METLLGMSYITLTDRVPDPTYSLITTSKIRSRIANLFEAVMANVNMAWAPYWSNHAPPTSICATRSFQVYVDDVYARTLEAKMIPDPQSVNWRPWVPGNVSIALKHKILHDQNTDTRQFQTGIVVKYHLAILDACTYAGGVRPTTFLGEPEQPCPP